jgi:hypothetical protein
MWSSAAKQKAARRCLRSTSSATYSLDNEDYQLHGA